MSRWHYLLILERDRAVITKLPRTKCKQFLRANVEGWGGGQLVESGVGIFPPTEFGADFVSQSQCQTTGHCRGGAENVKTKVDPATSHKFYYGVTNDTDDDEEDLRIQQGVRSVSKVYFTFLQ